MDSEFEENLKAFGGRLDKIYSINHPIGKLIPNVSHDWIQFYNRQSALTAKSKSPNKSSALYISKDQNRRAGNKPQTSP